MEGRTGPPSDQSCHKASRTGGGGGGSQGQKKKVCLCILRAGLREASPEKGINVE